MKTSIKTLLHLLLLLNVSSIYPQMILKSSLLSMPVLIELPNSKLYGSGFFFTDSNSTFLITAKHNLFDMKNNSLNDSKVVLYNYPHDPEIDQPNILKIDIEKLVKENKYIFSTNKDICALEIATTRMTDDSTTLLINYFSFVEKVGPSTRFSTYGRINIALFDSVKASTDLFIFGYPSSLGRDKQFDPFRPLLRNGIVSSKDRMTKTIIIDCPAYPGNSGGPVVIQEQKSLGIFRYSIIGIVVEYIPFKDYWQSMTNKRVVHEESYNSGLSVVIPIDELIEILNLYFERQK